jgi:hypothetical protein
MLICLATALPIVLDSRGSTDLFKIRWILAENARSLGMTADYVVTGCSQVTNISHKSIAKPNRRIYRYLSGLPGTCKSMKIPVNHLYFIDVRQDG